jgi:hypothetical protein
MEFPRALVVSATSTSGTPIAFTTIEVSHAIGRSSQKAWVHGAEVIGF